MRHMACVTPGNESFPSRVSRYRGETHFQPGNRRRQGNVAEKQISKHENVLEQVYEPRRLLEAWQQVKTNAGAAGIDRI